MTKQCDDCKHFDNTGVFELCKHPTSEYRDNMQKLQFHSTGHMKQSQCTGEKLFERSK